MGVLERILGQAQTIEVPVGVIFAVILEVFVSGLQHTAVMSNLDGGQPLQNRTLNP